MKIYILSDADVKGVEKLPVIKQNFFKKNIDFLKYDYLIFTSKNGVIAADKISIEWKNIPSLCIGISTSKMVEKLGGKVGYIAKNFYGDKFALELLKNFNPKKNYLYIRGKNILSNLYDILKKNGFNIDNIILYETICNDCKNLKKPQKDSYIIFSSPSTIDCFFKCFKWDSSYKAVAIGKKTASFIPSDINYIISPVQTFKDTVNYLNNI